MVQPGIDFGIGPETGKRKSHIWSEIGQGFQEARTQHHHPNFRVVLPGEI